MKLYMNCKRFSYCFVVFCLLFTTNSIAAQQKKKTTATTSHKKIAEANPHKSKPIVNKKVTTPSTGNSNCPNCATLFNDWVEDHEKAYVREGIKPQQSFAGLQKLVDQRKLRHLKANSLYKFESLQHSKPYFLPKVQTFLADLANTYKFKCKSEKVKYVPFIITSGTRTKSSVNDLMKVNENSTENSAHLKGKTFDISYKSFGNNKKQRDLFINALAELKKKGRCYVKYERNGCLHITVN